MNKAIIEQLELEKRKREILKEAQNNRVRSPRESQKDIYEIREPEGTQKFAWEYELERYRKEKIKERFYFFGAICGILALALTLYFNAGQWIGLF